MSYNFGNIKILLVEDNKPMVDLLKSVLQSFGATNIHIALNGVDGFRKFCEVKPDIVIADWMMNPMDGVEMSRRIRNDPKSPNQYVPIILMSGFSEKHRVLNARDAGITEFIVKPFNARDLYKRIQKIVETPRQFVRSENFFGPDRRRKRKSVYKGPFRRKSDRKQMESLDTKEKQKVERIDLR